MSTCIYRDGMLPLQHFATHLLMRRLLWHHDELQGDISLSCLFNTGPPAPGTPRGPPAPGTPGGPPAPGTPGGPPVPGTPGGPPDHQPQPRQEVHQFQARQEDHQPQAPQEDHQTTSPRHARRYILSYWLCDMSTCIYSRWNVAASTLCHTLADAQNVMAP